MTAVADVVSPPKLPDHSDGGREGRGADMGACLHVRAWEIVALTDSDGKRWPRPRRWRHFTEALESGGGPVDGWALASAKWNAIKAFVQRIPAGREVEAWVLLSDELDRVGDLLVEAFGDLKGWGGDGVL